MVEMERGIRVSIFAVLIVAAAVFTVYYLNLGPTGFAVFQQQTQTDFDQGIYTNTLYNGSAVVLDVNQTSGEYSSKVFDVGSSATWNNLTWQGNPNLSFEVRTCASATCSNESFISTNLNNMNLSGQYFQYKVSFNSSSSNETLALESISIDYSVSQQQPAVSVSISEPTGTKDSASGVALTYTTVGENLTCLYYVTNSANGITVIENTTISGCANTSFDITSGEGSYSMTVYVSGPLGKASASSSFSIDLPSQQSEEEEEAPVEEEPVPVEPAPEVIAQEPPKVTSVSLTQISGVAIIQGNAKEMTLSAQNTGTISLSSCIVSGDDSGFFVITDGSKNIGTGETASFAFLLNVSRETIPVEYNLGVSLTCAETGASQTFAVTVIEKKLDFNITNVQRTREDRVRIDYSLTELSGQNQDVEIYFSIKDASGLEVANASQNRSIDANKTDDFRTNVQINESLEGNLTLSAAFNSQVYSSSVLEPITLGAPIGGFAIFGGVGGTGGIIILVIVVLALGVVFFVARRMRKLKKAGNPIK